MSNPKFMPASVLEWVKGYFGPGICNPSSVDSPSAALATIPARCAAELLNAILGGSCFPIQAVEFGEKVPHTTSASGASASASTGSMYYVVEEVRVNNCNVALSLMQRNGFEAALTPESWAQCSDVVNVFQMWRWIREQEELNPLPAGWKPQPTAVSQLLECLPTATGGKRPRQDSHAAGPSSMHDLSTASGAGSLAMSEAIAAATVHPEALSLLPSAFERTRNLPDPTAAMIKAINLQRIHRLLQVRQRLVEAANAKDTAAVIRALSSYFEPAGASSAADGGDPIDQTSSTIVGIEKSLRSHVAAIANSARQ